MLSPCVILCLGVMQHHYTNYRQKRLSSQREKAFHSLSLFLIRHQTDSPVKSLCPHCRQGGNGIYLYAIVAIYPCFQIINRISAVSQFFYQFLFCRRQADFLTFHALPLSNRFTSLFIRFLIAVPFQSFAVSYLHIAHIRIVMRAARKLRYAYVRFLVLRKY